MYVLVWRTVSAITRGLFWCLFPDCEATREIKIKITLEWAQKQFVTRVQILFYFFHDITNPSMTIKTTIFIYRPRVSLARFSFCWLCHNQLLMTSQCPNNCDTITWIVISIWSDIDFIHGDIHDRSCKKSPSPPSGIFVTCTCDHVASVILIDAAMRYDKWNTGGHRSGPWF